MLKAKTRKTQGWFADYKHVGLTIGVVVLFSACTGDTPREPTSEVSGPVLEVTQFVQTVRPSLGTHKPSDLALSVAATGSPTVGLSQVHFNVGPGGGVSSLIVSCDDNPNQPICGGGSPPPPAPAVPTVQPIPAPYSGTVDGAQIDSLFASQAAVRNAIGAYLANMSRTAVRIPGQYNPGLNLLSAEEIVVGGAHLRIATFVDWYGECQDRCRMSHYAAVRS